MPNAAGVVADQPARKLINAKVASHARYVTVRMAQVAVSRHRFAEILALIKGLRAPPVPA